MWGWGFILSTRASTASESKLYAFALFEQPERSGGFERLPDATAGHRVVDLGDGEDPRRARDVLSVDTVVAQAIRPLVVVQHRLGDLLVAIEHLQQGRPTLADGSGSDASDFLPRGVFWCNTSTGSATLPMSWSIAARSSAAVSWSPKFSPSPIIAQIRGDAFGVSRREGIATVGPVGDLSRDLEVRRQGLLDSAEYANRESPTSAVPDRAS